MEGSDEGNNKKNIMHQRIGKVSQRGVESMNEKEIRRLASALERIGKILGAVYMSQLGDVEQREKAERLNRCGFSNSEIADILVWRLINEMN